MINLDDEKEYFILIDGQGGTFGGGRIYEGLKEVSESFIEWGNSDEMENLENYSLRDCIEVWTIDIKKYSGIDFEELNEVELNKTLKELII